MKFKTIKYYSFLGILGLGTLTACVEDPNSPGVEYMPDMYRSPAIEAYVDYAEVRGRIREDLITDEVSLTPPFGTIPYYGTGENVSYMMPYEHGAPIFADRTHGLYGIEQDTTGYADAAFDVNPIPYSAEVEKEGKELYGLFCIHCHGETGDGQGTVVTNSNGKFPPPPSYSGPLKDLPAGKIFYSVTYGKGMMGAHASQLNKEERWKIVWYVQKLQGKDLEAISAGTTDADTVATPEPIAEEGH